MTTGHLNIPFATTDAGRCQFKTEKGRQCKLVQHTDATVHKFVQRSDKDKDKQPLSQLLPQGFNLTLQDVKADDVVKKTSNRRDLAPRDDFQKRADKDVVTSYAKWVKAGRPVNQEKFPWSEYIVPPRAVDAVLDIIRRALGTGGHPSMHGKVLRYKKGTHSTGNTRIQFVVKDPDPASKPATGTSQQ